MKLILKLKLGFTIIFLFTLLESCKEETLKVVTVADFSEFISSTEYVTDAEKYGWSFVQLTVYDYKIVNGANWRFPNGVDKAKPDMPVTQISYKDALVYCEWLRCKIPSYEEYWTYVKQDKREIIKDSDQIYPAKSVNVVGNTWDITKSGNQKEEIRLAGGSYLCSKHTCDGTNPNRKLYVSRDTGNSNIGFSIIQ
ncbi:hypothetical protein MTsPCn9_31160 [Croceitalea sp. MTPC9]|uniref:SUMF1/EgtB/PvdO family nonheme iron enzyme n=1 Tax=unclassified Croceitalea TaxID=2632280 RepID=UPI002B3E9DE3|nr:hypothetical protein MTsPCn6_17460 [Croceitalea sp. MTPC6]GMN18176.1 hypothetical protein MTsPCn9_31160 [Croceitalea sp. MTPC9]